MKTLLQFTFAAVLPLAFLSSCALPKDQFDLRGPAEIVSTTNKLNSPSFLTLDVNRQVAPRLLKPNREPYKVGPGDVLNIEVAEDPKTIATTRVMPDGMLHYETAGGINVKGRTIPEISAALTERLIEDYPNSVVSVNLADAQSQRFWTLGQIRNPGAYPIQKPTTLLDAISMAGGMAAGQSDFEGDTQEMVDLDRSILIRGGDVVPVNFRKLIEQGDMSQNVYVEANDYIYLPSVQHKAVYVLGEVNRPGPVYFDSAPTLLSSLAAAGSTKPDAILSKALVIRGSLNEPKVAVVNITEVMRGKASDAPLEAGDIVWVPRSAWTNLKRYTEAVLVTAAQAVAVTEGIGVLGGTGNAGVTINAGN
ncbi:MAG: hypothetical protein HKN23_19480 [Verrucomicrobiales bacterium]|nr:hypothetical protein [Verrucomicrobiales bacterium]